ncbi:MAG: ThuA domain-containing protein [Planctomycetes bacterium]|nr:ThuA domain-containing protein [Planctomycetota bacterium]
MKSRLFVFIVMVVGCFSMSFINGSTQAESKAKIKGGKEKTRKILIYTKNGKGFVHKNIPTSIECIKGICKKNGWACEASDDPAIFTTKKIAEFDVLVFSNTNNETFDTDEQKKVFQAFIRGGGGFVAIHSACASERKWPWYWENVGCKFVSHPKIQEFDIKVVDKKHPSTEFLPDIWKWTDECYILNRFSMTNHILLAADLRTVEFNNPKKGHPGHTFGDYTPLCWYREFDGGRQWYTALGHAKEYYKDPTFIKHIEGGIKWAMGTK